MPIQKQLGNHNAIAGWPLNTGVSQYRCLTIQMSHNIGVSQCRCLTIQVPHNTGASQYRCLTIQMSHNTGASQYRCLTIHVSHNTGVSQYRCLTIQVPHNTGVSHTGVSQYRCLTIQMSHNTGASQCRCLTIQVPHNTGVSQYRCLTIQMSHNTDVSQYRCLTIQVPHNADASQYRYLCKQVPLYMFGTSVDSSCCPPQEIYLRTQDDRNASGPSVLVTCQKVKVKAVRFSTAHDLADTTHKYNHLTGYFCIQISRIQYIIIKHTTNTIYYVISAARLEQSRYQGSATAVPSQLVFIIQINQPIDQTLQSHVCCQVLAASCRIIVYYTL